MGENDAHGTSVEHLLDIAVATLVRDPDQRCHAQCQCCAAQVADICYGQKGVLQINEDAVEPGIFGQVNHLRVGDKSDAKGLFPD